MKKVGLFIHSRWAAAERLAEEVRAFLADDVPEIWATSEWDDKAVAAQMPGTELLISLGGDGTMLRAARSVIPHAVPLLGVNMGRLGFLAEVRPGELIERLRDILRGRYRLEQRAMVQAQVPSWGVTYHGLNDVVVGRTTVSRPAYVDISIDGCRLAVLRCDAIIIASATGSTAYSLSAGGPILHPESKDLVLTPVAPHLAAMRPLVLSPDTVVELEAAADEEAMVSVDGQMNRPLAETDKVVVCRSPHVARFVRFSEPADYYDMLAERLDWLRVLRASEHPELLEENGIARAKPFDSPARAGSSG